MRSFLQCAHPSPEALDEIFTQILQLRGREDMSLGTGAGRDHVISHLSQCKLCNSLNQIHTGSPRGRAAHTVEKRQKKDDEEGTREDQETTHTGTRSHAHTQILHTNTNTHKFQATVGQTDDSSLNQQDACMHTYIYTHIHTHIHAHTHTHTHEHSHIHTLTNGHRYSHKHTFITEIHTHTRITHTMQARVREMDDS